MQRSKLFLKDIQKKAESYDKQKKYLKTLFSAIDFVKYGFEPIIAKNKFFTKNIIDSDLITNKTLVDSLFNTPSLKKEIFKTPTKIKTSYDYIDQATLKVTISDEILATHFPYFLNPKKYNKWTFPHLSQKKLPEISDTTPNELKTIYQAGYPVENLKGNLTYSSKGGPTFRMTKGKIQGYKKSLDFFRSLDNYKCQKNDRYCFSNNIVIGTKNIVLHNDYVTGGGSSGSMIIDKDYNLIGIYWGGNPTYITNTPSKFEWESYAHPIFWKDKLKNDNQTFNFVSNFSSNGKLAFFNVFLSLIIEKYSKARAIKIFKDYQTRKNKINNGFNFDNVNTLKNNIVNFVDNHKTTNQEESKTIKTDAQKIALIEKVLNILADDDERFYNAGLFFNDAYNHLWTYFTPIFSTRLYDKVSTDGDINYKQQLIDLFKENNIKTYNLNP